MNSPKPPADSVFVYGTLQLPEVLRRVLRRVPERSRASLRDFERGSLSGENYPAIVAKPGGEVQGLVLFGLGDEDWRSLDEYEGELYQRCWVTVTLEDQRPWPAQTYVLSPASRDRLTPFPWSLPDFVEHHLAAFLEELEAQTG